MFPNPPCVLASKIAVLQVDRSTTPISLFQNHENKNRNVLSAQQALQIVIAGKKTTLR
jgi:hypothetical protein